MSNKYQSRPYQKYIKIHKFSSNNAKDEYLRIRTEDLFEAMNTLTPARFQLYLFLACNKDNFGYWLSRTNFVETTGRGGKDTYDEGLKDLEKYGYLIKKEGKDNSFDFYEKRQNIKDEVSPQGNKEQEKEKLEKNTFPTREETFPTGEEMFPKEEETFPAGVKKYNINNINNINNSAGSSNEEPLSQIIDLDRYDEQQDKIKEAIETENGLYFAVNQLNNLGYVLPDYHDFTEEAKALCQSDKDRIIQAYKLKQKNKYLT